MALGLWLRGVSSAAAVGNLIRVDCRLVRRRQSAFSLAGQFKFYLYRL